MGDNERALAHQSQEKFQFYAVALVFTILGFSIQTASFDGYMVARICEIVSWLLLLISGLSGLSHLEWNPIIRVQMVRKEELDEKARQLEAQKNQGISQVKVIQDQKIIPIEERITEYNSYIDKLDVQVAQMDHKAEIKYWIFKWAFTFGITLLAVGRSVTPIVEIVNELCGKA